MANPSYFSADLVDAVASVCTLAVALFVLVTARSIQRAEGVFRQNQIWNEFGHAVARFQKNSRIGDLLIGKTVEWNVERSAIGDDLTSREAFLLMSFFNVVSNEYNAYMARTIDDDYFIHSLGLTCRVLKSDGDWIFGFLESHGYEASYVSFLRRLTETDDCNARIAAAREKRSERTRRARLRQKLRGPRPALAEWVRRSSPSGAVEPVPGARA